MIHKNKKKRKTFFILPNLILFLFSFHSNTLRGEEFVAVSIQKLEEKVKSSSINQGEIYLSEIKGVLIGDSDIFLIGKKGDSQGISISDIALAFRVVFNEYLPPGLIPKSGLSPDSETTNLIYFGGVKNTPIGNCMAECLKMIHLIGSGKKEIPIQGFWHYGNLPIEKFKLYPHINQYIISSDKKLMLMRTPGVSLKPIESEWKNVDPGIKETAQEWAKQFEERYKEVGKLYPEFTQLQNFFNLYMAYTWAKENIKNTNKWKNFFKEYRILPVSTPISLRMNEKSIAGGISCQLNEKYNKYEPQLDDLGKIIVNKAKSTPESLCHYFQFLHTDLIDDDKQLKEAITELQEIGLYGRSIILYLKTERTKPYLKILCGNLCYSRPTKTARNLKWLIRQTLQGEGDFQSRWRDFYQTEFQPIVTSSFLNLGDRQIKLKPLLIFISDTLSSEWMLLRRVNVLKENFVVFFIPQKGNMISSLKPFLHQVRNLPIFNKSNFAVVLQTSNNDMRPVREDLEKLRILIGNNRVLINPRKEQFLELLYTREVEILLMQLHIRDEKIIFDDGSLSPKDLFNFKKLVNLKYVMLLSQGRSLGREISKALQTKGVGLVSILPRKSLSEGIKNLCAYLQICNSNSLPPYYIPTILGKSYEEALGWVNTP